MKKIIKIVGCTLIFQAAAKEAISLLEGAEPISQKNEHTFYKQARNLGKAARENLYEGELIERFDISSLHRTLGRNEVPEEVAIRIKKKDADAQLFDKVSINRLDDKGRSALHWAAFFGSMEMVKCIIECGGDVNIQDSLGWTPLHCAAVAGHAAVVAYLVEKGADRKARTKKEATAYWIASVGQGSNEVIRALEGAADSAPLSSLPTSLSFLSHS